ncbi:GORAB protein, partial [Atractosteus spatula]|nr:GORAB protein [Atractosteus spatula]
ADQAAPNTSGRGRRHPPTNRSRQQLQREKALLAAPQDGPGSLPLEQQLTRPKVQAPVPAASTPQEKAVLQRPRSMKSEQEALSEQNIPTTEASPLAKELERQEVELLQEQRLMEEKNKRKKALLAKAIAEKSKRTQAETVKLKRIQKELQALDDMVSNDIGILRSRIEQASWDYSIARKRFEKAEAEYIAAKLDLHKKTDIKEQLTEHLYTIIQQNEQRKAGKLEELMKQLELEADEERLELEIEVERMLLQQQEDEDRRAQSAKQQGETGSADGKGQDPADQESQKDSPPPESEKEKLAEDPTSQNFNSHCEAVGNEVSISAS